jgi:hypothetical protein
MIVYQKDGKDYLLLANDRRGVMKISTDNLEKAEKIETRVGVKGQPYETISGWTVWTISTNWTPLTRLCFAMLKAIQ